MNWKKLKKIIFLDTAVVYPVDVNTDISSINEKSINKLTNSSDQQSKRKKNCKYKFISNKIINDSLLFWNCWK